MAIDFEKIKKIDANSTNVGMIQNSAGDILWRKKYETCSLGLANFNPTAGNRDWKWYPYYSSTFSALLDNNYFHYGDRVDLFQSLDGMRNVVVSWYDGSSGQIPERYVSFLKTAAIAYRASTAVSSTFYRNIAAQGLLTEYGRIKNQTEYHNHSGYATDNQACITVQSTTSPAVPPVNPTVWNDYMGGAGPQATFYNQYYDFDDASILLSELSGSTADKFIVEIVCTGYDASTSSYIYTITITANCSTLPGVAFSYKEESSSGTVVNVGNITLVGNGSSSSFTVKGDKWLRFYRQSCYLRSNGSVYGAKTSPFLEIYTSEDDGRTFCSSLKAVYPSTSSTNYGFLMDANGNITNSNKNVGGSFCYCTMKFKRPSTRFTKLRITYTQNSEVNYDFGQFSKIDKMLCASQVADAASTGFGASLYHSCKGENSSVKTITYDISSLEVGTDHLINFKYHKDGSVNNGTDTFKISKIEFLENCEYSFGYDDMQQMYGLTVINHGSTAVNFEWRWFYMSGSSGYHTSYDAPLISADIPAGGTTTMWLNEEAIPQQSGMIAGLFECNGALHLFIY